MSAVLDQIADWSEPLVAVLESDGANPLGTEGSTRATAAPNVIPSDNSKTARHSAAMVLVVQRVVTAILAGTVLFISIGFSILLIVATLISLLCGLACYS